MTITITENKMTVTKQGASTIAAWIDPQGIITDYTDRVRMELSHTTITQSDYRAMKKGVVALRESVR